MKSIRKYVYLAALTVSALSLVPSQASAQEAAGTFTLTEEVHWQNAIVPAGKYWFKIAASGPLEVLTLRKTNGDAAGFMLLVEDLDASQPKDGSQLVVVSRSNGNYVSAMKLPEFGMTLHFAVPAETRELAKATATATAR
ncbi:MAG: hypothetical protein ACLQLC_17315 [Candidatus Sulfotelmatobacter sp.]